MVVSREFVEAFERAAVELDGLRKVKKLSDAELQAYREKVDLLNKLIETQGTALTKQEQATTESDAALQAERGALAKCREVVADYTRELDRVRAQRDRAKRLVLIGTAAGVVVGFIGALLLGK